MTDTQWPRFEVFVQDRADRPYRNAGSVHAVDAEMALQNGRDIFVRRPPCVSLWVVPERSILSASVGSDGAVFPPQLSPDRLDTTEEYHVFGKSSQRQSMTFVVQLGKVVAHSAAEALRLAKEKFSDQEVYVWWLFPVSAVVETSQEDIPSMFEPAHDKAYRMPREYRVLSQMLELRSARGSDESKA